MVQGSIEVSEVYMSKVEIGSDEMVSRDLPDLVMWLEKRVSRRKGSQPLEMVFLALVAAECLMNICRESWVYEESPEVAFEELKLKGHKLALAFIDEHNSQDN